MPIKSKVFIQTLQKSQERHEISFAFEFNNENTVKVFGANLPPPNTIKLDLPPNTISLGLGKKFFLKISGCMFKFYSVRP